MPARASFGSWRCTRFSLTAAYSLISYKTPWCLLSFWHGMILLAGVGAAALLRSAKRRFVRLALALLLLGGAGHLAWQAVLANANLRRRPAEPLRLCANLARPAEARPPGRGARCRSLPRAARCWSKSWRRTATTGRCPGTCATSSKSAGGTRCLADPFAPVMIVSAKLHAGLDENKTHVMVGYFQLRPQVFLELYVEVNLVAGLSGQEPAQTGLNSAPRQRKHRPVPVPPGVVLNSSDLSPTCCARARIHGGRGRPPV